MRNAFDKEVFRSITHSWGRFLAIAGIVALGCGFYAGLRMTGPDMRSNADAFYDGTQLYDLRMLSSLGWSDDQVDQVSDIEGVEAVMPARSTDAMVTAGSEQYAVRIDSLDSDAATQSDTSDGIHAVSDDDSYLNRPILAEGEWATEEGECMISADKVTNNPISIGDTITVEYGTDNIDDVLETRTFTVVGKVHSSVYDCSTSLGSTSLGSGTLQQYLFVSPQNFKEDAPYTELYVRVAGAADEFSGSDAYQAKVDQVADRIDEQSDALADSRRDQLKADAQATLDEKTADYNQAKTDADSQLADAQAELDDASATIADSESQLASGQAQYESGAVQLSNGSIEAQQQLDDAYSQLESSRAQLVDAQQQLDDQASQLQSAWTDYETQLASWQDGWNQYQDGLSQIQAAIDALDPTDPTYSYQLAALQQKRDELESSTGADLSASKQQLDDAKSTLDESQASYDAAAPAAQQTIDDGWTSYAAGQQEYYAQAEAAQATIDSSQSQLDSSAAQLSDAQSQIDQGKQQLADAQAQYDSEAADAQAKLDDAKSQIDQAQSDIDAIDSPDIYTLDRTKNYGVSSFKSDGERVDNIAAVFPFIFFLVAALVALTTMTRMVDEERVLIGTYKALGYGKMRITSKYLAYAAIASIAGAVVGIVVLSQVLPYTICLAYAIIYNVPQQPLPLNIDMPLALLSAGMGVGITLFATWAAAAATLREQPAALMLPRAPKAGKRILMERITPLWKRLSFSWKVTFRNLFRYKKRFAMTVIGIGGCTALLLTGLGLSNAINDIIDKQFGEILHYNVVVTMRDDADSADVDAAEDTLRTDGGSSLVTRSDDSNTFYSSDSHEGTVSTVTEVPEEPDEFRQLVTMRTRIGHQDVALDDDSMVITEKLATTLGVGVGDEVTLYDQDSVGNATGDGYRITVSGIVESYVGNYAFMGSNVYRSIYGEEPTYRSIMAQCTDDMQQRDTLTADLRSRDQVETVAYNDETIDSYRQMLSSVDMIVVVLVTAAAALAFIVLYNLTNINITERQREIASLKVLGFTPREVDLYIFREIILLTLIGAALGLVLGVWMEGFVVVTAEVDQVMFGRDIHVWSFVAAYVLTVVFSILVMLVMRRKLDKVDMVESLKSVE